MNFEHCECLVVPNCDLVKRDRLLYEEGYRKVQTGKWVLSGAFDDFLKCSICGNDFPWQTAVDYDYCPKCGSKMVR